MTTKLRNFLDRTTAEIKLKHEPFERKTVSFYRYVKINNPQELRDKLFLEWSELGVFGRVYVASEGINAQISVPEHNWDSFEKLLNAYQEFEGVPFKFAVEDNAPSFIKLKIKVRNQIVADGLPEDSYDLSNIGKHLTAEEWNRAMEDSNTIVVDMRNAYEGKIGKFENAIVPDVDRFKDELPLVKNMLKGSEDKKVLLYCTGGVRCEKTSAYLKHHGFNDVNQLFGGVIYYKHQVDEQGLENKFKGKNFVFDDRRAERISCDVISRCDVCGKKSDDITNCVNKACDLLFVECENCSDALEGACSMECNKIIHLPEDDQKKIRRSMMPSHQKEYRARVRPKLQPVTTADRIVLFFRKLFTPLKTKEVIVPGKYIAKVKHYYKNAGIVEFVLESEFLDLNSKIQIEGVTTKPIEVIVNDLFVCGKPAMSAKKGDEVTIKIGQLVRKNDKIYLVSNN